MQALLLYGRQKVSICLFALQLSVLLTLSCLPSIEMHFYVYALAHELGCEVSTG